MTAMEILENKRTELQAKGNPLEVEFSADELNILGDISNLRNLKLVLTFPKNYKHASDIFDCTYKILHGDEICRVLEFCVFANPCLRTVVYQVFGKALS